MAKLPEFSRGQRLAAADLNTIVSALKQALRVRVAPPLQMQQGESGTLISMGRIDSPVEVAVPPCGEGIPARDGDTPGVRECCIFRLERDTTAGPSGPMRLIPVMASATKQERRLIYNLHTTAFTAASPPSEYYVRITRDGRGRWFCDAPASSTTGDTINSTTAAPHTTPSPNAPAPCSGRCKWTWSAAGNKWNQTTNPCATATTSTTTSTTTSSSTTPAGTTSSTTSTTSTTGSCLCPTTAPPTATSTTTSTSGTGTTSSTSTSTTTTSACRCGYPSFCGTVDGECTYTDCIPGYAVQNQSSSQCNTTTTCNCNTTSTTTIPPECSNCCHWMKFGEQWVLLRNDCVLPCECRDPDGFLSSSTPFAGELCDTPGIGGSGGGYGPPHGDIPGVGCTCRYIWVPSQQDWVFVTNDCHRCLSYCVKPISPPTNTNEYQTSCVACVAPTTPHPCANCYSSTSSTTSTTGACGAGCKWKWHTSAWRLVANNCNSPCSCFPPSYNGTDTACEVALTACVTIPTSTTTTTTTTAATTTSTSTTSTSSSSTTSSTTTTPNNLYCLRWTYGGSPWCQQGVPGEAAPVTVLSGPGTEAEICNNCPPVTSTTTTTTTTIPVCGGPCKWTWNNSTKDWTKDASTACTGGCTCANPAFNGSSTGEITYTNCVS